jgi:hypothetical protein
VLSYHYWVGSLFSGSHLQSGGDFVWDVEVVDVDCSNNETVFIAANTNYRLIDDDGFVRGQGVTGDSDGWYGAECEGHSLMWAAIGLASGWPMSPQPAYNWDEPESSPGSDGEVPEVPSLPIIARVEITGGSPQVFAGEVSSEFTATAYDADNHAIDASFTWRSANASVASPDDPGTFFGQSVGTTIISVTANGVSGVSMGVASSSRKLFVNAMCGTSYDPNMALIEAGGSPDLACTPSAEDEAAYGDFCLSTSDPILCIKIMAGAKADGHLACLVYSQGPECGQWLDKLLAGDTAAVQLSTAQWTQLLADTAGKSASAPVLNAINPDNGVTYPFAKVWYWNGNGDNEWRFSIGHGTVYYDATGAPAAFHDDYNFHPDEGDNWLTAYLKDWINDASDGKSFRVHWP